MVDARKEKIDGEKAWERIAAHPVVYIGKGKKVLSFEPAKENREAILKAALGRTGNLRAPAVVSDNGFFIGYNDLIYEAL